MLYQPNEMENYLSLSRWRLLLTKCLDRDRYYFLKYARQRAAKQRDWLHFDREIFQLQQADARRLRTFKHSGNAGDIIYALPAIRALTAETGAAVYLALDVPLRATWLKHPLGGVMLNRHMFEMLEPLLSTQDYLHEVTCFREQRIDYDLDAFRDTPLPLDRLGISRWYFYFCGVAADLAQPWLKVKPNQQFADCVIVARSFRYRNPTLDYAVLRPCPRVVFVGLEDEFRDMQRSVPRLEWAPVQDFLELAEIIAGCRLFIGNQSFPFSLAEALKVPRILETDPESPNVVPTGAHAYDVLFQRQFAHLVARLTRDAILARQPVGVAT